MSLDFKDASCNGLMWEGGKKHFTLKSDFIVELTMNSKTGIYDKWDLSLALSLSPPPPKTQCFCVTQTKLIHDLLGESEKGRDVFPVETSADRF